LRLRVSGCWRMHRHELSSHGRYPA
jgi:hypothetical protein